MILTSQTADYPHLMSDKPLKEGWRRLSHNACKLCPHSIPPSYIATPLDLLSTMHFPWGDTLINNDISLF